MADIPEPDELTATQTPEVCEQILENTDRFVKKNGKTSNTDWVEYGVDIQGAPPSNHGVPRATQQTADEYVDKMLE